MTINTTTKRLLRLLTLLFLFMGVAGEVCWAQPEATLSQAPDCQLFFSLTTAGQVSGPIANYGAGSVTGPNLCTSWILGYASVGFSGVSLRVESAPAATATTPGAFVAYAGTVVTGVNPNTSTTGAQTTFSNGTVSIPWIRVTLTSATGSGTVYGILQGWNSGNSGGGGGGGGGCSSPCTVVGPDAVGVAPTQNPVQVSGFDGTDVRRMETDVRGGLLPGSYPNNAAVNLSTSGLTQIIALSGGKAITLSHISVAFASSVDFQLEYGTGSSCGTGTTALTGVYKSITGIALDTPFTLPAGDALCVNLGASVAGGGLVVYSQQ